MNLYGVFVHYLDNHNQVEKENVIRFRIIGCDMINGLWKADPLFAFLAKNSGLTKVQLDTLLSYSSVKQNEGSLNDMVRVRDKMVTKGSFLHTLHQARQNLRCSIYSIFLLGYTGLLGNESIEGLVRVTTLLNDFKKTGRSAKYEEIMLLIEDLCDRLVPM